MLGWFLILGLLFSIQDYDATLNSDTKQPVAQIFLDTVGLKGACVLMTIVIGAMFFCGCVPLPSLPSPPRLRRRADPRCPAARSRSRPTRA